MPCSPKPRIGLPGPGVERDQPRVDGRDEDAALAAAPATCDTPRLAKSP